MRITKLFCDCCGVEFTKTDKDIFGDVDINVITDKFESCSISRINQKRIINRFKSGDICGVCAVKIYDFINKLKVKT